MVYKLKVLQSCFFGDGPSQTAVANRKQSKFRPLPTLKSMPNAVKDEQFEVAGAVCDAVGFTGVHESAMAKSRSAGAPNSLTKMSRPGALCELIYNVQVVKPAPGLELQNIQPHAADMQPARCSHQHKQICCLLSHNHCGILGL
jgi:hypothetical protein